MELENIMNSGIHDYELLDILMDYNNGKTVLQFKTPAGNKSDLVIQGFLQFTISRTEPWGPGMYVNYSNILENGQDSEILIELNSGDEIMIKVKMPTE